MWAVKAAAHPVKANRRLALRHATARDEVEVVKQTLDLRPLDDVVDQPAAQRRVRERLCDAVERAIAERATAERAGMQGK